MVKKISWHTTFGEINIFERTFLYESHLIRPFCLAAGVKKRAYSFLLQRRITDFGADLSFSRASEKLKEHYGISIPISSIRKITERHGKNVKESERLKTDIPDEKGIDCVKCRMKTHRLESATAILKIGRDSLIIKGHWRLICPSVPVRLKALTAI